ncbi:MAG TPA: 23S rRNA (pseudouridine(1915)-N(3))-methyltransferase RlmH [Candidatus Paceibacterota bacterium]|nr:23S rRNA (pseudouridine(1915)-N(3))-methyltransferase RlmH [Candidatus Paceibacterota bacterium]
MKIALVTVGKTETPEIRGLVEEYSKRVSRYAGFEMIETTEDKLARHLGKFDRVFLLDDRAREYRSIEFADFVGKIMNSGIKSAAFVVGGPFGFPEEAKTLASGSVSLSKMTFPHDLVRAIFLEQLYRAFSILKNEKYHHE